MKHLLIAANRDRSFDVDKFSYNHESIRKVDGLIDLGNRSRQIGKTTAIIELANEMALLLPPEVLVVVFVDNMRLASRFWDKLNYRNINAAITCEASNVVTGRFSRFVLLSDEVPKARLEPLWSDPRTYFKAGWMHHSEKV
jgi:hypothetical protein